MERLNTRIRGGGTNVWIALAAIVGIFALVLSTLVVASPTASAQDAAEIQSEASENSGVTTAAESDDESGLEADASTAVDEGETPSASDAPSAVNPTVAPSDDEALVPETLGEQAFSLRAPNDRIDVNVTKIEGVPEADQQLVVGQKARVEGTWDASKADPQPGDSFTVGFPSQLKIPAGASFPLVSEDSETYGTCTVNSDNSFTCVLNDSVTGKDDVKGTWFIEATATEYTNAENLDFTVPGDKVTVPLPGDGGGISDGTKLDFKKQGAVQPDESSIRWTVDIPGSMLAALETPNDGNVTLRDKLPEGLKVCEPIRDSKLSVGRAGFQEIPDGLTLEPGATGQIQIGVNANEPFKNDQIYRVEYTTCTTNGGVLTQGKYENQFFVGDEYESGIVGYDGFKPLELNKSGSVLDSLDGVNWTINIPGSAVNEDGTVDLSDNLGGDQKICTGGVNLRVQVAPDLIVYPNSDRKYEDVPNVSGVSGLGTEGGSTFSTKITGLTKDAALVYKVTYKTCLDAIPDRETEYSNSATVNNNPVSDTTNAPNPQARKDGVLNKKPVKIGDVEYPAGTTQSWTVTIPGYELETADKQPGEKISATDVIDSTAGVCGESGDLKDRLNLKVLGQGVGNYADNVDLTDKTEVTPGEGNSFSLVTQKADEKDFSRARNYVISYTTCTSSGGQDAQGTEYGNVFNYGKEIPKKTVKQDWNAGGTASGVSKGSFSLLKGNTTGLARKSWTDS
ncbi:Ig-like domain-containing protein [Corynebacterium flavescens]